MIISTSDEFSMFPPFICPEPSESTLRIIRQAAHTYRTIECDGMQQAICLN